MNSRQDKLPPIRVDANEKAIIKKNAEMCNLSISAYVRKRALDDLAISIQPNKAEILKEIAPLSSEVELIEDTVLKKTIEERVLKIWQYLNM